jgi:hypothetical protein
VVFGAYDGDPTGREYNAAAYLLVTNGQDAVGSSSMTPDYWWVGYDVDLGLPLGARTRSASGLWRREFEAGPVLLNEPGASTQTVQLTTGGLCFFSNSTDS